MSVGSRIGSKARRDGPVGQTGVDFTALVTIDEAALPDVECELFLRRKGFMFRHL